MLREMFAELCDKWIAKLPKFHEVVGEGADTWVGWSRYWEVGREETNGIDAGVAWVRLTVFGLLFHLEVAVGDDLDQSAYSTYAHVGRDFVNV